MVSRVLPFVDNSPRDQLCCEAAAFFNESIIRETITGRYLKSAIGHRFGTKAGGGTYTRRALIVRGEGKV
jgi:hypothetical protein